MVLALQQGGTSNTSNPVIIFVYTESDIHENDAGFTKDIEALSYRVLRPDGSELIPWTVLDVSDAPTGVKIRQGTYAPPITIDAADPLGAYRVEWEYQVVVEVPADVRTSRTIFQVESSEIAIPDGYVLVTDMRRQGVPLSFCNEDIIAAIERASETVDCVTGRHFSPTYQLMQLDGTGEGISQRIEEPIIGVEQLNLNFTDFRPSIRLIEHTQVRIYNRHMRGLKFPDDRESPRIDILRVENPISREATFPALSRRFVDAQQNVEVTGYFGYTDPDGSPLGKTPENIKRVTMMLAMKDLRPLWGDFNGGRGEVAGRGRITQEKTRDQQVKYGEDAASAGVLGAGYITGDPVIDNILAQYVAPMNIATV